MARSRLSDEGFPQQVAALYIAGLSADEMADELDCHRDTIYTWIRDARVQAHASRLASERINRITRKIDKTIEGRLAAADEIDTEVLLKIRKEFLDRAMKIDLSGSVSEGKVIEDTVKALEASPELGAALQALIDGKEVPALLEG